MGVRRPQRRHPPGRDVDHHQRVGESPGHEQLGCRSVADILAWGLGEGKTINYKRLHSAPNGTVFEPHLSLLSDCRALTGNVRTELKLGLSSRYSWPSAR